MSEMLDSYVAAYGDDFEFAFDNNIMLNWYPRRIMALTDKQDHVLELGIGHGYTSNLFADYYTRYFVIDGSTAVIEQFHQQYPNSQAKLIESYFENWQSDETFDVIILGFILEHVDDPALVLKHYKQFLKPGGRFFISVPNGESLHRRFGHEAGMLPDMLTLGKGDLELGHQRLYSVSTLTEQLEACGYRILRKEGIFLKPFTTKQMLSLNLPKSILEGMCKTGVDYPELCSGLLFEAEAA